MEEGRGQEEAGERSGWLRAACADIVRKLAACLPGTPLSDIQWLSLEQVDGLQRAYEAFEIRQLRGLVQAVSNLRAKDPNQFLRQLSAVERLAFSGSSMAGSEDWADSLGTQYGDAVREGDLSRFVKIAAQQEGD